MTTEPQISYQVSTPAPTSHYFHVEARFQGDLPEEMVLSLPAWTPGSYLMREYARHLVKLTATDGDGNAVSINRLNKAEWTLHLNTNRQDLTVHYQIYAYELTVRTSYLDRDYGIINGPSLFLYHKPFASYPAYLQILPAPGWDVATALSSIPGTPYRFYAANFDVLVDSPIQMGHLTRLPFFIDNRPHQIVLAGFGADVTPPPTLVEDVTRIIETAREMFGSLPYDAYYFLVTLAETDAGGLEHLNSTNIMVSRARWRNPDDYTSLLSLFAHEYFHLWNVKRLRPLQLGPFNYQEEVYTSLLWALEGITDYFAYWLMAKSGVVPAAKVLEHWARDLRTLELLPGREWSSVAEASREAWIRQYRPDANTPNITISYYLKGALVGLFLDLELRHETNGAKGLDAVWRDLWNQYADQGFPEPALEQTIEDIGGNRLQHLLARYVHATDPFDESVFASVGLTLERSFSTSEGVRPVWLGLDVVERQGRLYARHVGRGDLAEQAGLSPDDEIIALNRERVTNQETWNKRLQQLPPKEPIHLYTAHRGIMTEIILSAGTPRPDRYCFVRSASHSPKTDQAFQCWLGVPYPFPEESPATELTQRDDPSSL